MCSTDCAYDNSAIILIGDVYCPNTKCLGKLCLHKKTFQSLGRSGYQCPQCLSVCQVRNIPFEDQTNSFFLSLGAEIYIFNESVQTIQDVIGDVYCPGKSWQQQRFILKEEVSISKKEIESLLDSLGEFLKAFDQANKVSQILIPKAKFEIAFTKAKDELFSHCYKDIVDHLNRQIRLSFWFEKNKTCVFSIKILNITVINSFLQMLST